MSIDRNIDILTGVSPQEQADVLTDGVITEEVAPDLEIQNQEQLMGDQISDTEEVDVAMLGPLKKLGQVMDESMGRRAVPTPKKAPEVEPDMIQVVPTEGQTIGKPSPTKKDIEEAKARGEEYPVTEFNLNQIENGDDLRMWVDSTAQKMGYKHEVMNMNDMANRVKELGYSEAFIAKIVNPNTKLNADPSEVYKMMLALNDASAKSMDLAKQVSAANAKGQLTDELLVEFRQAVALEGAIARGVKRKQVDVARSLRAFGQARTAEVDRAYNLEDILEQQASGTLRSGRGAALQLAKAYESATGVEGRIKMAEATLGSRIKDTWVSVWINGLLSSPPTHVKNMAANLGYLGLDLSENTSKFLIGQARRMMGAKDYMKASELIDDYVATIQGFREGMQMAKVAFKNNAPVTGASKAEVREMSDPFNIPKFESDSEATKFLKSGWGYLGKLHTLPGRALMAEDEVFKGVAYRRSLIKQSNEEYTRVFNENVDDLGRDAAHIKAIEARDAVRNDPTQAQLEQAIDFAGEMTFTKKLPEGMRGFENMAQHPAFKVFFPFIRTPMNIAITLNDKLNPWSVSKKFLADWKKGGVNKDAAMARVATSGILYTGISSYVMEGKITGAGPFSSQVRSQMQEWGWQPFSYVYQKGEISDEQLAEMSKYAVVTSGKGDFKDRYFVSYAGMEPVGAMMGMFATLTEYSMYEADISKVEELFTATMLAASDYVSEVPMVQGFVEIGEIFQGTGKMTGPDAVTAVMKRVAEKGTDVAIGGTPVAGLWSSGVAYVNRILSPDRRVARAEAEDYGNMPGYLKGFYDAVTRYRSRNPFLSDDVPRPLDKLTGQPMEHPAPEWWMRAFPLRMTKAQYSPARDVLTAYQYAYKLPKRIDGVDLSSQQTNEIIGIATSLQLPKYGRRTLEDQILYLVDSPTFQMATQDEPEKGQAMIAQVFEDYYGEAREQFKLDSNVEVISEVKKESKRRSLEKSIQGILQQ